MNNHKLLWIALILFSILLISSVATFAQQQNPTFHVEDLVQGNEGYGIKVTDVL